MARRFHTGFEHGHLGQFGTILGAVAVNSAMPRTGTYAMRVAAAGQGVIYTLHSEIAEVFLRLGYYYTGHSTTGIPEFFQMYDSDGDAQLCLVRNAATGLLEVHKGSSSSAIIGTSTRVVPLDGYMCIELHITVANSGVLQVKLDGVLDIDLTPDTQATALSDVQAFRLGSGSVTGAYGYYDDFAINDVAGGAPHNTWIGRGGIYPDLVAAVGHYADLIASVGDPWDCVKEVPPNDATYVQENAAGKKSTYVMSGIAPSSGVVSAISVVLRAVLDAPGAGNIAPLVRLGTTDDEGATEGLDVTVKTVTEILELDPDGAAWDITKVNALEVGAVVR